MTIKGVKHEVSQHIAFLSKKVKKYPPHAARRHNSPTLITGEFPRNELDLPGSTLHLSAQEVYQIYKISHGDVICARIDGFTQEWRVQSTLQRESYP